MQHTKNKWFTLVELIVVITILAILWTIAFISLQWYSKTARNSTRTSDIKNTVNVLELFSIKTGKYPLPWNAVDKTASWGTVVLWQAWDMDVEVQTQVERLSKIPLDPTTGETMSYATTNNRKEYELKYDFEIAQNSTINTSYAEDTSPYVKWNYNGLYLLADNNVYYSVPWLHTSTNVLDAAVDFELNDKIVNYQVSPLTNSWVTLTKANVSTNYTNFGLALKTAYTSEPELNDGLYLQIETLDDSTAEPFVELLLNVKAEVVVLPNPSNLSVNNLNGQNQLNISWIGGNNNGACDIRSVNTSIVIAADVDCNSNGSSTYSISDSQLLW